MTTAAMKVRPDQEYERLHRMILKLVHKFHRRYGGDWEELVSEANFHFMRACSTHNPRKGAKLITHAYWCVWYGLLRTLRPNGFLRRAPKGIQREDVPLDDLPYRRNPFRLNRLLTEVSDDARTVIRLTLSTDGRSHRQRREMVVNHLRGLGWSMKQVLASFDEIREAVA